MIAEIKSNRHKPLSQFFAPMNLQILSDKSYRGGGGGGQVSLLSELDVLDAQNESKGSVTELWTVI